MRRVILAIVSTVASLVLLLSFKTHSPSAGTPAAASIRRHDIRQRLGNLQQHEHEHRHEDCDRVLGRHPLRTRAGEDHRDQRRDHGCIGD